MAPDSALPRSTPEAQGVASGAIRSFVEAADRDGLGLHSFMLLRHGSVLAEGWWAPYAPERRHMLYSLSKSFASSAIGLLAAEGRLSLDAPILQFFPDDAPADVGPNLAAMRVRDLLAMATGHDDDTTEAMQGRADGNWARGFLACPVQHAPGTHFVYNSGATYMLSAIVQALTGDTLLRYLQPRLLEPLGISDATWESSPQGINIGGWGLSITTDAIARFGQLYLQDGVWAGKRLLPEGWVAQATRVQVSNGDNPNSDWAQGYGYQFWRCRHNAYRGDGAFGQFCVVLPDHEAVFAITGGTFDMQAVLNAAWQHLLPALHASPLPDDPAALAALREACAALRLPSPAGSSASPHAAQHAGAYTFSPNDQQLDAIAFEFGASESVLTLHMAGQEERIVCGTETWNPGESRLMTWRAPWPLAARGAWSDADTFVATLCFVETPYIATITCTFAGDEVLYQVRMNVAFGPTQWGMLAGKRNG